MLDSKKVKEILFSLGADLCGIAGTDRFGDAPKGYHPLDVMPSCKSVISFGCRFPVGTLSCKTPVPYTRVRNSITPKMDAIALDFCIEMEKHGVVCVPIPTNESEWDTGSMIWLGCVLCNQELEPDEMKENMCNDCNLCVNACPVNALQNREINQNDCWNYAFGDDEEKQTWRISCHKCRDICPYNLGSQNKGLSC